MNQRPFWHFLPYINNRTGWKPIGFPAILIVPFGIDGNGNLLTRTQPRSIEISILDTIRRNKVSGHQNIDLFYPDRELFTESLSVADISRRMIDTSDFQTDSDWIYYTNRMGLIGKIPLVTNGLYYDISDILVDVENLESGRYELSYKAIVNRRIYDNNNAIICIEDDKTDAVYNNVDFVHPGEIIEELKKNTPSVWFSNIKLAQEPLFDLYKPLSDCLQNVYDEQTLLSRINFVNHSYPETIPYLGRLLGWDIPYFPKSLDSLRRNIIRYTTSLQKDRGTFRAVNELFKIFGFEILVRNLWFDLDNNLINPSYESGQIRIQKNNIIDILDAEVVAPGFYKNEVPLIRRPDSRFDNTSFIRVSSDVKFTGYVVSRNSEIHLRINDALSSELSGLFDDIEQYDGMIHQHIVNIDKNNNIISETYDRKIFNSDSIEINFIDPYVSFSLDGSWNDENEIIYLFAEYEHQGIIVPDELINKRSNFFEIKLVKSIDLDSEVGLILDHMLEFLYRIKAFHSLLKKFIITIENDESYLVTDYCYGPNLSEIPHLDSGEQQIPPAVNVGDLEQCTNIKPFKEIDYAYRTRLLKNLISEYEVYLQYDDREFANTLIGYLQLQYPDMNRNEGIYNEYGQDIFINNYHVSREYGYIETFNLSNRPIEIKPIEYHDNKFRYYDVNVKDLNFSKNWMIETYSDLDHPDMLYTNSVTCFKGRVNDELLINLTSSNEESFISSGCRLNMGNGVYYLTNPGLVRYGVFNREIKSKSTKPIYSDLVKLTGMDIVNDLENRRVGINNNRISNKQELHYWNKEDKVPIGWETLADRSVSLNIEKTNMHFPGTRFINMGNIESDFVSEIYKMRPWDYDFCDDFEVILCIEDGNQYIRFDDIPFTVHGNGVKADIPSMSDHTTSDIPPNEVVHKIYSQYVSYWDDNLELCDENDVIEIQDESIFGSSIHNITSNVIEDSLLGYPALTGFVEKIIDEVTFQSMFLLGSGIKDESAGHRLLCGDVLNVEEDISDLSKNDDIDIEIKSNLHESLSLSETLMDGTIPSMLEFV